MKYIPILFSPPMIQAILEGRKIMTRRIVKEPALTWLGPDLFNPEFVALPDNHLCRYGYPGDGFWVKETFTVLNYFEFTKEVEVRYEDNTSRVCWLDDREWAKFENWKEKLGKKPSLFMFKTMSRIFLEVTEVRVERLHDIKERDVKKEGTGRDIRQMALYGLDAEGRDRIYRYAFKLLWQHINGPESWEVNPWVWVISFKYVGTWNKINTSF